MNEIQEIQQQRLSVLEEATRRMKYKDYKDMEFADSDRIVYLYKNKKEWEKKLRSKRILQFIKDLGERAAAEEENKKIDAANKLIKDNYIKPLEFNIKVLEIELILFSGLFQIPEDAWDIYKRVYPEGKKG